MGVGRGTGLAPPWILKYGVLLFNFYRKMFLSLVLSWEIEIPPLLSTTPQEKILPTPMRRTLLPFYSVWSGT